MKELLREFFGFGGYVRPADGAYSLKHIINVAVFVGVSLALAIFLGLRNRKRDSRKKNIPLVVSAILIDTLEIIKIVIACVKGGSLRPILYNLPLFFCSIQLITIPLAAFSKGRLKEAAVDFVFAFGLLGGVFGIVGAAQNYNAYPAFSWDNIVSAATHSISAFASLYIGLSKIFTLKMKNLPICEALLGFFVTAALIINPIIGYNYMFLVSHDGTPYSIFYNMVGGNPILYPMIVILIFVLWIVIYYVIARALSVKKSRKNQ